MLVKLRPGVSDDSILYCLYSPISIIGGFGFLGVEFLLGNNVTEVSVFSSLLKFWI